MLLPGAKQEEALHLTNQLRQRVERCGFHYDEVSVKITISCGVSAFNQWDTLRQVFERTDQALYSGKENGRNCCVASRLTERASTKSHSAESFRADVDFFDRAVLPKRHAPQQPPGPN